MNMRNKDMPYIIYIFVNNHIVICLIHNGIAHFGCLILNIKDLSGSKSLDSTHLITFSNFSEENETVLDY